MKFKQKFFARAFSWLAFLAFTFLIFDSSVTIRAQQTSENLDSLKSKASVLVKEQKYTEALPLLEKIVVLDSEDAQGHFYLGFALLAQSANTTDKNVRPSLRQRARREFVKAKELGIKEPVVTALIQSLPEDGSEGGDFSINQAAHKLMEQGEAAFTQGKLDDAFKAYQKALQLDPKLYEAALFSGDVYIQKDDFANAEIWYQKAITINPNRETAYRYSATPLMKQGKFDQARDRYIEAYISEPYSNFSRAGLTQWAQVTKSPVGHPEINIPTNLSSDEKGDWISYNNTRAVWRKQKFAKTFPNEKSYRHSLAEEADALRSVIASASAKSENVKNLDSSLSTLKKLNDAGLLEAYILLAQPDEGIAHDFPLYAKNNRDKLRRYVVEYVVAGAAGSN